MQKFNNFSATSSCTRYIQPLKSKSQLFSIECTICRQRKPFCSIFLFCFSLCLRHQSHPLSKLLHSLSSRSMCKMYFEFWSMRAANSKSKTSPNAAVKLLSESLLSKRVKIFEIQTHAPASASHSIIRDTCSQAKRLKLDSEKVERCELEMNKTESCAELTERRRKKLFWF